jgi:hypothetical protein
MGALRPWHVLVVCLLVVVVAVVAGVVLFVARLNRRNK